jgi:hypothetical protein
MDSATYIHQEQENQFPSAKREGIVNDYLARKAGVKALNYVDCEWCQQPMLAKNIREELYICPKCYNGKNVILAYKRKHKISRLGPADRAAIANSKTTRLATGKSFN